MRLPIGSHAPRPRTRGTLLALALVLAVAAVPGARAARLDATVAMRLDPRLAALADSDTPVTAWVTFADKGEQGPGDLSAMLARAEAALTPANRARRLRAGVRPLVSYDDLPVSSAYVEDLRHRGFAPYGVSRWGNEVAVRVPGTRLAELAGLAHVARLRPVERARTEPPPPAGPESPASAPGAARDRAFAQHALSYGYSLSQLGQINVPAVHDSGYIGTGVTICVLDDGFNFHDVHDATRNANVPPGYERDFIRGLATAQDTTDKVDYHHGMWTFGCMAANLPGVYVGAAPGATYALGRTEYDPTEHVAELVWWRMGAEWADSLGADVISTSLGYYTGFTPPDVDITYAMLDGHTTIITRAAEIAASKGILVVASAGNDGSNAYPFNKVGAPADANGDSVIAAGAVSSTGVITSFSSRGPTYDGRIKPDLLARGLADSLVSSSSVSTYTVASGTSFSAPILAGLAACLIQARPAWPATTVIRSLYQTASRATTPDTVYGHGLADGLAALRWTPDTAIVPPPSVPPAGFLSFALRSTNPVSPPLGPARFVFALGADAPASSAAHVRILDAQGRLVRTVWSGVAVRGQAVQPSWDGTDDRGRAARSGVYLAVFDAAGRHTTLRLVMLR